MIGFLLKGDVISCEQAPIGYSPSPHSSGTPCFIVEGDSRRELHLIACLDKGFLHVFAIIVSSVGWYAPHTQGELGDEAWMWSSYHYVSGGAGEAKPQGPRVKDGIRLNVGDRHLNPPFIPIPALLVQTGRS